MNDYVEDLERRIEQLELALEANKRNFHVLEPDENYIVTEPFMMVDKLVCSFSRRLHSIIKEQGKHHSIWGEWENGTYSVASALVPYQQLHEYISYIVPKGTIFKIKCYEVKKRKSVSYDYNFVRTIIEYFPEIPKAKGCILNFRREHFAYIKAESYNDLLIEDDDKSDTIEL